MRPFLGGPHTRGNTAPQRGLTSTHVVVLAVHEIVERKPINSANIMHRLLQGFEFDEKKVQHRTVFPGLQFTLAGIMGKPDKYYIVPAIRMAFVVMSYL